MKATTTSDDAAQKQGRQPQWLRSIVEQLPRFGRAGTRTAELHSGADATAKPNTRAITYRELERFAQLRLLGTIGTLLMAIGGLGAGALPVVGNPFHAFPLANLLSRMLYSSTVLVLIGIGLLMVAWLMMGFFVVGPKRARYGVVATGMLVRTYAAWVIPLLLTAPLFTQDIYSYLAQGSIVRQGMDPYIAGPVDLLGTSNELARSVPLIWSHSPSPYGPVALGIASAISQITGDHIAAGVIAHRFVSTIALFIVGWALVRLSLRCGVRPQAAIWLGILNPLALLHLVAGIHNESIMLALILVGLELTLLGLCGRPTPGSPDSLSAGGHAATAAVTVIKPIVFSLSARAWGWCIVGTVLIALAGMVKVTGFIALGFVGMAIARRLGGSWLHVALAAAFQAVVAAITVVAVSIGSGMGLGWISAQGGAATIRSWMSITTDVGVVSGFLGNLLGLGDHTEAILTLSRGLGVLVAMAWMLRMLFAVLQGRIHPLGGYGSSVLVLVLLFPVVHPWYLLWAIVPLAAWADRRGFRLSVIAYSTFFSFTVLPRGLALPPSAIIIIYVSAALIFIVLLLGLLYLFTRNKPLVTGRI